MRSPPEAFKKLAKSYVPAWIDDMRHVDLEMFQFDFDLTFAVLVMNPDGTIYHRFGGRDEHSATTWISMEPLLHVLERGLKTHEQYSKKPRPVRRKRRTVQDFPSYARWIKGVKKVECIHCHQIGENEVQSADMRGGFDKSTIWRYPSPTSVGLVMNPSKQDRVDAVLRNTPAARAGIRPGDTLISLGGVEIASVTDLQASLHHAKPDATAIPVSFRRGEDARKATLRVKNGWKQGTPKTFAWRSLKWPITPGPGFGGDEVGVARKKRLGIDPNSYAFQISYMVTWGERAHVGRKAQSCGLRKGDVVYSVAGKSDFEDQNHFHAWYRLTRKAGETIEVRIVRGKQKKIIRLEVVR